MAITNSADNDRVAKELQVILIAIENLAEGEQDRDALNAAGATLVLGAIKGLCELGEKIYKSGGIESLENEDK